MNEKKENRKKIELMGIKIENWNLIIMEEKKFVKNTRKHLRH